MQRLIEVVKHRTFLRGVFVVAIITTGVVLRAFFVHPAAKPVWQLGVGIFGVGAASVCIALFLRAHEKGTVANPWPLVFGPLGTVQLFAGLAIIFAYLDAPSWVFYPAVGISFASFVFSLARSFFRNGDTRAA